MFVLSSFSPRLLLLLAPVLASVEIGMLALALKEGWARDKVRGWGWLIRNAGWLRRHRRETQKLAPGARPRARAIPEPGGGAGDDPCAGAGSRAQSARCLLLGSRQESAVGICGNGDGLRGFPVTSEKEMTYVFRPPKDDNALVSV